MGEIDGSGLTAMKTGFLAALFCILPIPASAQGVGQTPPQRTYPVHRLQPSAYPELPKHLVMELERRGCTIPQPYTNRKANVIRGEFLKPGQTDWAVLCTVQDSTTLLVFWNGSAINSTELAKNPDDTHRIFDWYIRVVDRRFMMDRYKAYGGPRPPPIDHQGIESGGETASVVLYYYRGKWLKLQGAD
jgi:hypothetical protein